MESKSKTPVHLCEIIDTCCLNKISRAVVAEILKFILVFLFLSILLEIGELILITLYRSFFCGEESQNTQTSNVSPLQQNVIQSKTKSLFGETLNLAPQNYDFNF